MKAFLLLLSAFVLIAFGQSSSDNDACVAYSSCYSCVWAGEGCAWCQVANNSGTACMKDNYGNTGLAASLCSVWVPQHEDDFCPESNSAASGDDENDDDDETDNSGSEIAQGHHKGKHGKHGGKGGKGGNDDSDIHNSLSVGPILSITGIIFAVLCVCGCCLRVIRRRFVRNGGCRCRSQACGATKEVPPTTPGQPDPIELTFIPNTQQQQNQVFVPMQQYAQMQPMHMQNYPMQNYPPMMVPQYIPGSAPNAPVNPQ